MSFKLVTQIASLLLLPAVTYRSNLAHKSVSHVCLREGIACPRVSTYHRCPESRADGSGGALPLCPIAVHQLPPGRPMRQHSGACEAGRGAAPARPVKAAPKTSAPRQHN